ncbi:MAG: four helix bundle protein [Candidatus Omnitrophica bacterium]|nr:four helix bundle protein [Candidatus Omnitrophota bacterium]
MRIKRFEDLECWQQARSLVNMIYKLTKKRDFSKDFRLRDQITGAGVSIVNNIAEGFDSQSNNEFIRFLGISRRSISEVENCLYVALDQEYIDKTEFQETFEQCEKTKQITDGFLRYLRKYRREQVQRK